MGFTQAVRTCLAKYVTFSGRARRPEYWWFVLAVTLVTLAASVLDGLLFGADVETHRGPGEIGAEVSVGFTPITGLVNLATILPLLAAGWRRLHDVGRPGWVMFLPHAVMLAGTVLTAVAAALTGASLSTGEGLPAMDSPVIAVLFGVAGLGSIGVAFWLFVQLVSSGTQGPNRFGPEPPAA